jgi:hypothetical protein
MKQAVLPTNFIFSGGPKYQCINQDVTRGVANFEDTDCD